MNLFDFAIFMMFETNFWFFHFFRFHGFPIGLI